MYVDPELSRTYYIMLRNGYRDLYVAVSVLVRVIVLVLFPLMSLSVCHRGPVFVMVHICNVR